MTDLSIITIFNFSFPSLSWTYSIELQPEVALILLEVLLSRSSVTSTGLNPMVTLSPHLPDTSATPDTDYHCSLEILFFTWLGFPIPVATSQSLSLISPLSHVRTPKCSQGSVFRHPFFSPYTHFLAALIHPFRALSVCNNFQIILL